MTDTPKPQTQPDQSTQEAPVPAPALPYIIHANLREYGRRIGVWRIVLALGLTTFFFYRFGVIGWIVSVAGITFLISAILWFLAHRSVEIKSGQITVKNALGKLRTVTFTEIEEVKVFVNYYEPTFGVAPRITIAVRQGEPVSLYSLYWPVDELDKLLAVLRDAKVKTEYYADAATYTMIAKQFPTHATYLERHPWKIAWIVTGVIVAIVVAIAVLLTLN